MKLIVGLGNPGREYDRTRHNAGFLVVDELARRHAAGETPKAKFQGLTVETRLGPGGTGEKAVLLKPATFMNRSGQSVQEALRFYKIEPEDDLVVIVDDLALPVGSVRVRAKGGAGGHNGLSDIDRRLGFGGSSVKGGGKDDGSGGARHQIGAYPRVRVGIGAVPRSMSQVDWVLSRFTEGEQADVERSIATAADAVEVIVDRGVEAAMNRFNERVKAPDAGAQRPPTHPAAADGASGRGGTDTGGMHPGWTG